MEGLRPTYAFLLHPKTLEHYQSCVMCHKLWRQVERPATSQEPRIDDLL